ncbi:MAG: pyridoxal 5'-phosphate synthase glutaminase subunit PdxT [Thermoplasmatales archaeon]
MEIGVIDIQGDVSEHLEILKKLNVKARRVKKAEDLKDLSGIIIPGGESTVIGSIMKKRGISDRILESKLPVMGTCAGLILISEIVDGREGLMPILHIDVTRNAYGSQRESFEAPLEIKGIGGFKGVFIRAPIINGVREGEVLAEYNGRPVAVRERKNLGLSFHPEIYGDPKIHEYFVDMLSP